MIARDSAVADRQDTDIEDATTSGGAVQGASEMDPIPADGTSE